MPKNEPKIAVPHAAEPVKKAIHKAAQKKGTVKMIQEKQQIEAAMRKVRNCAEVKKAAIAEKIAGAVVNRRVAAAAVAAAASSRKETPMMELVTPPQS